MSLTPQGGHYISGVETPICSDPLVGSGLFINVVGENDDSYDAGPQLYVYDGPVGSRNESGDVLQRESHPVALYG